MDAIDGEAGLLAELRARPVEEPGTGRDGGLGIVGMRERVALLGGVVVAGAENGTWRVTATFPRDGAEPPAEVRT